MQPNRKRYIENKKSGESLYSAVLCPQPLELHRKTVYENGFYVNDKEPYVSFSCVCMLRVGFSFILSIFYLSPFLTYLRSICEITTLWYYFTLYGPYMLYGVLQCLFAVRIAFNVCISFVHSQFHKSCDCFVCVCSVLWTKRRACAMELAEIHTWQADLIHILISQALSVDCVVFFFILLLHILSSHMMLVFVIVVVDVILNQFLFCFQICHDEKKKTVEKGKLLLFWQVSRGNHLLQSNTQLI